MAQEQCFWITSRVVSGGVEVSDVDGLTANPEHEIEVWNGSTLPHDLALSGSIATGYLDYAAGAAAWPFTVASPLPIGKSATIKPSEPLALTGVFGSEVLCCSSFAARLAGAPGWGPTVDPADCTTVAVKK
jgi:hypothetical protein